VVQGVSQLVAFAQDLGQADMHPARDGQRRMDGGGEVEGLAAGRDCGVQAA
jgi:hypothetical protein